MPRIFSILANEVILDFKESEDPRMPLLFLSSQPDFNLSDALVLQRESTNFQLSQNCDQLVHSDKRAYPCNKCNKSYSRLPHLIRHQQKLHTNELPYPCKVCGQSFRDETRLDLHQVIHSGSRYCNKCERSFRRWQDLRNHIQLRHSDRRDFPCNDCKKEFKIQADLNKHIKKTYEFNYRFKL